MEDNIKIIEWRFIKLKYEKENTLKILQYLLFSTLSITLGYLSYKPGAEWIELKRLVVILPFIYIYNYLFYRFYRILRKMALPAIQKLHPSEQDNISHSHALIINLITVYIIMRLLFAFLLIPYNVTIVSLILIYTTIYFLHRSLKQIDMHLVIKGEYILPALLQYKAYKHTHILAATAIGFPFLIGISLSKTPPGVSTILFNGIFAYLLFIYSWIAFYQQKYRQKQFLESYIYLIPSAFYPMFAIIFFLIFGRSLKFFYLLIGLSGLLYYLPYIYFRLPQKRITSIFTNEKIVLAIILSLLTLILFNDSMLADTYPPVEKLDFGYSGISFLFAILTFLFTQKEEGELSKYLRAYFFMPYLSVSSIHCILWLVHLNSDISTRLSCAIAGLSNHLLTIEISFGLIYIPLLTASAIMRRNKNGGPPSTA